MFVTNWISTTKIQKISEITNFFRHYFLSRTEVTLLLINFLVVILAVFPDSMKRTLEMEWNYPQVFRLWVVEYYHSF